jgi:hypothetical protein
MSVLTLPRGYQGDAMLHLRRAIEGCAFAVRMSKHHETCRVWMNASLNDTAYMAYREAFRTRDIFPSNKHPDHEPMLHELKSHYDHCSKIMHGSIFGMAGHFDYPDSRKLSFNLNFFDLRPDHSVISALYLIFDSHKRILHLLGRILEPYTGDRIPPWQARRNSVEAKLDVHREMWKRFVPDPRSKH